MTINVFHHQDRVVNQQADGHDHRQQCQQVDRVPHDLHVEQHADDRQRNGHQRNQRRSEGAEEQEYDHDNDQRSLDEGLDHLVDRGFDEFGRIVGNGGL